MSAPLIPEQVSPDGREIWDWATKFSAYVHRQDKMGRLARDIAKIGQRCGDCDKWMKSRECPREQNVNGRNRGPSGEAPICQKFVECRRATQRRDELTSELRQLADATPSSQQGG